jgi:hypothetical protein
MIPSPLAGTEEAHKLCDVYHLWPEADVRIKSPPRYAMRVETHIDNVWAIADDPLKVPNCMLCLTRFLDGTPVAVRYQVRDLYRITYTPL